MSQDRNIEQLSKRLAEMNTKERALSDSLRVLRNERQRDIEGIDRMYDIRENHIRVEIDHILHEIPNLIRDIERRQEDLNKEAGKHIS